MNDEGAARQVSQNPGNDPQKDSARSAAAQGDLLTSDEQLLHAPRWQGETREVPTTIRSLAKLHHLAPDEVIEETEDWYDFVDDVSKLIGQLMQPEVLGGTDELRQP